MSSFSFLCVVSLARALLLYRVRRSWICMYHQWKYRVIFYDITSIIWKMNKDQRKRIQPLIARDIVEDTHVMLVSVVIADGAWSSKVTIETVLTKVTHWGRVTHICVSKLTTIGSDNGLLPGRHQAIIWTSAGILLIITLRVNFSEL